MPRTSETANGKIRTPAIIAGIVSLAGILIAPALHAQKATAKISEDLRPIYATTQDIAQGKRAADSQCARCHGPAGISTSEGVPNLAAQRPVYLFREMRAYQGGVREVQLMHGEVQFLSPEALIQVAAYYANLDPASPSTAPSAARPDPVQAGKAASGACAGCHGESGVSATPGMPSLVGLDPQYLVVSMKAYKTGERQNDIMKTMVAPFTDADLNNLATYFAVQKPLRAGTPATGDKAAGQKAANAGCGGCHGAQGTSGNPSVPSLAGQDAAYLVTALQDYKSGKRADATMKGLAASLTDAQQADLAAFYAGQQPQPPNVRKPLNAAEWAERCDRCHGTNGNSTDPRVPALASQRVEYLKKVMHAYRNGTRRSPEMEAMSATLSETDIDNLANFYARQQARGIVFVTVPAR